MAAHRLDDDDPVVRLGRRVHAVDRLGCDVDGGVEAERVVRAVQVVVDRLRDTDHRKVVVGEELCGNAERVLAADRDERVDLLERLLDPLDAAVELVRVRAGGADDRAALRQDPGDLVIAERLQVPVDHPAPAVQDADGLVAVFPEPPADRADHRVQSGAIPAACEHPHPHRRAILATGAPPLRANRQRRPSIQLSTFTARAATRSSVTSEIEDWPSISHFALGESGSVSVGLNALEFVKDT